MAYGMYISAEGAQAQSRRLEVIANNLANVNTVGFKRDTPSFQSRFAEAIQQGQAHHGDRSVNDVGGGVKIIDVQTDFSPGRFRETGGNLDLAIVGDGFFEIQGEDDKPLLTRAGDFRLDPTGLLLTQHGNHAVLDQGGKEIRLLPNAPWTFSHDGVISQAGSAFVLSLVQPSSLGDLVKVGDNQFRPLAAPTAVPVGQRHVRQGYLELSGADPTRQMMAMIETSRAFEANTRMIQNHDSMTGALISRVLQS